MTLELADWMKMSARVRADLDRADFTSRQRRVMQFVFWTTLMRRRLSVRVPRLRVLEPVLGMDKSHLSLNLRQLATMRLLQIVKLDEGGMEIVILPDSTNWDVPWLYDRARFMGLVRDLDACTNQVQGQLLPPDPSLLAALADISAEQAYRGGVAESATGVTESATPPIGGVGGALTVHGFTASEKESTEPLNREPLNGTGSRSGIRYGSREAKLMKRLQVFLANSPHQEDREDMLNWGGDWRKNWVRKMPVQIAKALDILESENARGDWESYKSRGAALKDLAKRLPS